MLTITPCLAREMVAPFCRECKRPYSEAFYIYRAQNGTETLATALFEVSGDAVTALLYRATEPDDAFLFDGVLRAGLNYAAEQGIENGVIPEALREAHAALFAQLNYPVQAAFNITNFFQKYKSCQGR